MNARLKLTLAAAGILGLAACGIPDPDTPVTMAAARGDADGVEALIARGADPDARESHGFTALVLASRLGHTAVVEALLAGGADPDRMDSARTRPAWTPLMNAVHKGQRKVVRMLLEAGADVNARGGDGTSALMLAATEIDTRIVRMLLEAGADPHAGRGGSAALTGAVARGRRANVEVLLASAPDLRLQRGVRGRAARWLAWLRGQGEVLDRIDRRTEERGGEGRP